MPYNGNTPTAMTQNSNGDAMSQQQQQQYGGSSGASAASPQIKSYSNLQPVAINSFKQQQQPGVGSNYGSNQQASSGLVGTMHHTPQHQQQQSQQSHLNQQQLLTGK